MGRGGGWVGTRRQVGQFPAVLQEFIDAVGRVVADPRDHVAQVGIGVETVAALDQNHNLIVRTVQDDFSGLSPSTNSVWLDSSVGAFEGVIALQAKVGALTSTVSAWSPVPMSTSVPVSWSGCDDAGGWGIAGYDIYVSTDGGRTSPS